MKIEIVRVCHCCGKAHCLEVEGWDYLRYKNGTYTQDAFPYLSDAERELIISGICASCWEEDLELWEDNLRLWED